MAFAKALKRLRRERGLSQEDLALQCGLHRTYVSQLERGLKSPSLKTLDKIATALKIRLIELIEIVEKECHKNGPNE